MTKGGVKASCERSEHRRGVLKPGASAASQKGGVKPSWTRARRAHASIAMHCSPSFSAFSPSPFERYAAERLLKKVLSVASSSIACAARRAAARARARTHTHRRRASSRATRLSVLGDRLVEILGLERLVSRRFKLCASRACHRHHAQVATRFRTSAAIRIFLSAERRREAPHELAGSPILRGLGALAPNLLEHAPRASDGGPSCRRSLRVCDGDAEHCVASWNRSDACFVRAHVHARVQIIDIRFLYFERLVTLPLAGGHRAGRPPASRSVGRAAPRAAVRRRRRQALEEALRRERRRRVLERDLARELLLRRRGRRRRRRRARPHVVVRALLDVKELVLRPPARRY